MASVPKKYALLVGIDAYRSGKLNGSVNDVMGIKRILERQRDPCVEIRTLTATVGADDNVVENEADRPTFHNFRTAMQELVSKTNKGDCVYIHYSGHGTHKLQESVNEQGEDNEGRETNGFRGDLALCLLGIDLEQVDEFPCRFLASMLNDLVGTTEKKATVTLVLDCCFSARILRRSQATIRYLPHDPSITHGGDDDGGSNGIIANDYYSYTGGSTYRNVDMSPSWLLNPNGYSILVACAPHEAAAEVVTAHGESHGKLSYYLIKTLDKIGLTRKQREVYHHLQADFFANANTNISASNDGDSEDGASVPLSQTPVLYGNKEQPFWGEAVMTRSLGNMNESGRMPIYAVWLGIKSNVPFRLMAGEAHGFSVGDRLLLRPVKRAPPTTPTTTTKEVTMDPSDQVVVATISGTGSVTSSLHVDDINALTATNWVAEPQSRRRLGDYPVYLDPRVTDLPQLSRLGEVLTQHSLCVHQDPTKPHDFHLKLQEKMDEGEEDALVILDPSGNKIHGIPPLLLTSIDAEDIAAPLVHLAKYSLVRSLANPPAPNNGGDDNNDHGQATPFRSTFDLYIRSRTGQCYKPGEVMELQERSDMRSSFEIYFENKGPVSLHIYIYALSPIWEVEHVHRATLETVPAMPRANQNYYTEGFRSFVSKKLRTVVPNGLRASGLFTHCEDVVKVLVTTHPTSFDVLEQPAYGIIEEHKPHPMPRHSDGLSLVEQWDAFNFPIRTALRARG